MDLTPYVENLRNELAVAAGAGGEEARALAERLTLPLESAVRLTLLNALSAAMGEITRELAPGSVDVRLRGLDPEFVVTVPPGADQFVHEVPPVVPPMVSAVPPVMPSAVPEPEEGGTARINLRLPAHLKARAEEAAGQEGLSLNAWLVRALTGALEGGEPVARPAAQPRRGRGQGYTGWVQ
ncbi:toxin-antitoxin system HicB family antitoxin [Streptomyces kaniharaensis]|uniref:Toxin-antitoxin system HicB family antitoxin n=1 Tax=Streptomyces kaniharaensis TaxID=212423 RepID=A0A6N7KNT0_9ACTN|nr:toxin-antitoxin system HicB family antitoxin [Streptomyces kaniharaensis]MQS12395.1 toxin-antitoxin system HicB family antitoxin [Streptomyces kaniharaensis]